MPVVYPGVVRYTVDVERTRTKSLTGVTEKRRNGGPESMTRVEVILRLQNILEGVRGRWLDGEKTGNRREETGREGSLGVETPGSPGSETEEEPLHQGTLVRGPWEYIRGSVGVTRRSVGETGTHRRTRRQS